MRERQVQDHGDHGGNGEASLHDQLDGVVEALETLVVTFVGENVGEPRRHKGGTVAESQRCCEDESSAAIERHPVDNGHTGHSDSAEEEGGHTTKHGSRNANQSCRELGEDTSNDQEEARNEVSEVGLSLRDQGSSPAGIAGLSVGATGKSNDTIVLGKS
jgi:hypothetical protein